MAKAQVIKSIPKMVSIPNWAVMNPDNAGEINSEIPEPISSIALPRE